MKLGELAAAEAMLVESYEGLETFRRLEKRAVLESLVELYELLGEPDKARGYRLQFEY